MDVSLTCGGEWYIDPSSNWPSSARVDSGANRDWLGVKVILEHSWKTNFLWWNGNVTWEEDAVMHIEPAVGN